MDFAGQPLRRSMFENTHLTYYKPEARFPRYAATRPGLVQYSESQSRQRLGGEARFAWRPNAAQAAVKAPDIKLKGPQQPNLLASKFVAPVMPLSSTSRSSRLPVVAGPTAIVAPPPEVSQAPSRRLGLLQASGIAPAPEISQATSRQLGLPQAAGVAPAPEPGVVSSKRAMTVPGATVVAPAPVVQAVVRRVGDINIGPSAVVAPAPRLPVGEQHTISGPLPAAVGSLGRMGGSASADRARFRNPRSGRAGVLSGAGSNVVPPPPSVQGAGNSAGGGHRNALTGNSLSSGSLSIPGVQAVPPPPVAPGRWQLCRGSTRGCALWNGVWRRRASYPSPPSVGGSGGDSTSGPRRTSDGDPDGDE